MSYYNNVFVIFTKNDIEESPVLDWRYAGQMLPAGAIPIAVANRYNSTITEIINSANRKNIIDFVETTFQKNNWDYTPS